MSPIEELLTIKDVTQRLRVSRATVYRLIDAGRLAPIKVGKGVRFTVSNVEAIVTAALKQHFADGFFTVKEVGWPSHSVLWLELDTELPQLREGHLFLYPRPGVTHAQVTELARAMRPIVRGVSISALDPATIKALPPEDPAQRT